MWSVGVYDLGLTGDAFWALTFRQFVLLVDRFGERQQREDRRSGEVAAMVANVNNDWKKNPKGYGWRDFFPEHKEPPKVQTDDEMLDAMEMWTKSTAGLVS